MKAYKQTDGVSIQATSVLTINTAVTATDVLTGDGECATPDISEERFKQLPWYGNEAFLDNFYDSLQTADPVTEPSPAARTTAVEVPRYRVPVRFWVYRAANVPPGGRDGGVEALPTEQNFQFLMDALNEAFRNNGISVRFYMRCVSWVDEPAAVNLGGYFEQDNLATRHRDNAVINVHIVDQGTAGVFNPLYDAIFIPRIVYTNNIQAKTLPHEIGHYLSLVHTHFGYRVPCLWEPVRRGYYPVCPSHFVAPNTCSVTGDGFCDTPGDPNQSGQAAGCVYNGGERDYLNELYDPAEDNHMAYSPRACRTWFSNKQKKAMMWSLAVLRAPERARGNWGTDGTNNFDSFEPDNGDRAARELALNGLQRHSFHSRACSDGEDWVRFEVPAGGFPGAYFVEVTGVNGAAHPVTNMEIFTSTGTVAAGLVAGARIAVPFTTPDGRARLEIPCQSVTPGRWYLVRISNGGTQFGQYDLTLTTGPATGQPALPTVSGPDIVCNANQTFVLNNAPAGATVTWTTTTNLTPQSGTGPTATVSANGSGPGVITFSVQGSCGYSVRKNVQAGRYQPSDFPISGPNGTSTSGLAYVSPNTTVNLSAPALLNLVSNGYEWTVVNNRTQAQTTTRQSSRFFSVPVPGAGFQGITVLLRVRNICNGTEEFPTEPSVYNLLEQSSGTFAMYPNPASSYVEIAPDESVADNQAKDKDFEVVIYDNFAQEKLRAKTPKELKEKKLKLDVTSLPLGVYVVQITYEGGVEQKQLEIMR
jgi:hypothetical protein